MQSKSTDLIKKGYINETVKNYKAGYEQGNCVLG